MAAPKAKRPTRAELARQVERLEAAVVSLGDQVRSLAVLLERAEADRDRALMNLAQCGGENSTRRHLLTQARAEIERLTTALAAAT